jgi:hypothetical protein
MNDHSNIPTPSAGERYIAIDLHKHYLMVAGINAQQQVVLTPRKIAVDRWLHWAQANLRPTHAVVTYATTNAWQIYDQLLALVGRVVVAHPPKLKQIAAARVKTDKHDVLVLAQLLRADLIAEDTQRVPGARAACTRSAGLDHSAPTPVARANYRRQSSAQPAASLQSLRAGRRTLCGKAARMVDDPGTDRD